MPKKFKRVKSRAARGTGTIFEDKRRGGWVGRAPVGKYANGRTRYTEVRAPTQGEVVAKLKGLKAPGPDTTVSAWADLWLKGCDVRASTLDDYAHTVTKYIKPTLGHLKVAEVTAGDIERAAKKWSETLNPNTLKKDMGHLSSMFRAAIRSKLCAANPVASAPKRKKKKVESRPFAPADLARIITAVSADPLDRPYALLAAIGCRTGEALALDVSDFDPKGGTISITKTYTKKHGTRPPKTENGIRTVRVPAAALPAVRAAIGTRTKGALFVDADGRRRYHNSLQRRWGNLLDRLGLARRGLHQLRHSVATALVSAGVPVGDVAQYLGDTVNTVVSKYVHAAGTDPARTLDGLLGGGKVADVAPESPKALKNKAPARRCVHT